MKNHICLILLLSALCSSLSAQHRSIEFDRHNWKDILAKAKKENKLIYLDCYTSWCGPCKWMTKYVFTNDTVADFYNSNFINAKIDMEKGEGVALAKTYGIRAYPTMLFVNGDGEQVHRSCGSSPVQAFVQEGKNALDPEKQMAALAKKFNQGKSDPATALRYFTMLEKACQEYDAAVESYFNAQDRDDLASGLNWQIFYQYVNDVHSVPFQYFEANREKFSALHPSDSVDAKILQVYQRGMNTERDKAELEALKARFLQTGTKDPEKYILEADAKYYLHQEDWKNYAIHVSEYIDRYNSLSAPQLNSVAWTFYEEIDDKVFLEKAAGWMKKAIAEDDNYAYNDTYAALLFKLGKKSEAKAAALKAIELAKKSGEDYKETEALLKKINKL